MSTSNNLVPLFEHNLWANTILFEICESLDDSVLDAAVDGGYGSIRETLRHIASAESLYVGFLTSPRPDEVRVNRDALSSISDCKAVVQKEGAVLIQRAKDIPANTILEGVRNDGEAYRVPASFVYVQAINHSTEHRTQIATVLTQQGIAPPDLDGWSYLYDVLLPQGVVE